MAVAKVKKMYTCEKCGRVMDDTNFYSSKNLEKYPNEGKFPQCKKCLTMHINNWEPNTFLWILKEADVPYVESEWNSILEKHCVGVDPKKVTGMSVIGRYLSKMKLKQWSAYGWEDSQRLLEELDAKRGIQKTQEEYAESGFCKVLKDGVFTPEEVEGMSDYDELEAEFGKDAPQSSSPFNGGSRNCGFPPQNDYDVGIDLTEEDRRYLTLKWGKMYKPAEWVKLEQLWNDTISSFDIQTSTHLDYLNFICKASLKMNQAIDMGDIEGFNKLSKTYDGLMKSAKFTAAQNKAESGEYVDSIGELVAICETQGFIPKYHTDEPKDIVDVTLNDLKGYTYKLVTEEMGLGDKIESALQQMLKQQEQEEGDLDDGDELGELDENEVLQDADYMDFYDEIDQQLEFDLGNGEES